MPSLRRRFTHAPLLLLFGALPGLACGPTSLQVAPTTGSTSLRVGARSQEVRSFSDLEQVRDVAASGEEVFVATDRGLVVFARSGLDTEPRRILEGLPSVDVRGVALFDDGVIAATAAGIVRVADGAVETFGGEAPIGAPTTMHRSTGGELFVGGTRGLAVFREGRWLRFGEEAAVTTLAETPEGHLWVGTTGGAWYVEGDIIREHPVGGGMPEGYVRSVAPMGDGKAMLLLQGPRESQLGYFDGRRWWGYTVRDLPTDALALARVGGQLQLLTPGRSFEIRQPAEGFALQREGVALTPTSRGELRTARSYRARLAAPVDLPAPEGEAPEVGRPPSQLSSTPGRRQLEAPPFIVTTTNQPMPAEPTLVKPLGEDLYVADRHRGLVRYDATGARTFYRTGTLVPEDLQLAVDATGDTWLLGADRTVARFKDGGFVRVPAPAGVTPEAIASGPGGVFVTALAGGNTVSVFRVSEAGWSRVFDRELPFPEGARLLGLPHLAVTNEQVFWSTVRAEDQYGPRMRGAVVFSQRSEGVVFHRRGADPAVDGEGARSMPDEVSGVDASQEGYIWLPSLNGAIRVGDSQAIVFGEARGVRGEVVTDVAVGDGRVWLAAAEGVGFYEDREFDFRLPATVQQARPTALAIDPEGHLWGAGRHGVVYYDGARWLTLDEANGLPVTQLSDVEVDGSGRVWLLGEDQLLLIDQE